MEDLAQPNKYFFLNTKKKKKIEEAGDCMAQGSLCQELVGLEDMELGRYEINSEAVLICLWSLRRSASLKCLTLSLLGNLRIPIQVMKAVRR